MKITILIDNENYLFDYIDSLFQKLREERIDYNFIRNVNDIPKGNLLFLLGCNTILSSEKLALNKHNLVIHPSKLPEGRGSAALVHKILEGENKVYLTMFDANEKIDQGEIYFQEPLEYDGTELSDEIRYKQSMKVFELVLKFIEKYPNLKPKKQEGTPTYYPKRGPEDSELDINKTIKDQFNLLRVADNERYPAFFNYRGEKYIIKIFKDLKEKNGTKK